MPLIAYGCPECGAATEHFVHVMADRGCLTPLCPCGSTMGPMLSMGRGLTYFEEGRARIIHNLADQPVTVTSHEQHKRLMREHKVDWATERATQGRGGWI